MKKNIKIWITPFFISILPILALYSHNIDYMDFNRTITPIFYSFLFVIISLLSFSSFFNNNKKTSFFVSIWTFYFFSFGYIYLEISKSKIISILPISLNLFLLGIMTISLFPTGYFLKKAKNNFANDGLNFLRFVSSALILFNLFNIVPIEIKKISWKKTIYEYQQNNTVFSNLEIKDKEEIIKPDIYYFVFDRYGRQDILKKHFNFDNSEFMSFLKKSEFFTADESYANYPNTFLSLSSSLNGKYLDFLGEKMGDSKNRTVVYKELIENNDFVKFLKKQEYEYIILGDFWDGSKKSNLANQNANLFENFDEFQMSIYEKNLINTIRGMMGDKQLFVGVERLNIIGKNLDFRKRSLEKNIKKPQPKFVFGHFLLPHEPVVFSETCYPLDFDDIRKLNKKEGYLSQLNCANNFMIEIVEKIKEESTKPFVIIFQSDEGPYLPEEYFNLDGELVPENSDSYKIHASILNSVFLSSKENPKEAVDYKSLNFSEDMTPVNTFRIITNYYFNQDIPLLENDSYVFANPDNPYHFKKITNYLNMK